MESAGTSSYGRAAEALSRTFSNSPDKFNVSMRTTPSLQPRTSPLYSPDTRVFSTPEQHSQLPGRDESLFPLHRASAHGEQEQGFHDHMDHYAMDQLSKEWDGLLLGEGSDDLRNGADVYRAMRKDLRSIAYALKQSFGLVVDNRQYSSGGASRNSVQQLQPCITELKSVAKEMASATRMATDNYNLQVELTLQKHASQHLLAQLHEAQLARMAMEEEINSLRAEGQRAAATESQVAHLRRLNDELQAEAQQASGELVDMRRRARELEERLEAQRMQAEHLAARLREMELFEDSASLCASSDGSSSEGGGLAAMAAALAGAGGHSLVQGAEHHSCPGASTAARAGIPAVNGGVEAGEASAVPSHSRQVHARDLPIELRRLLGRVLRRRDAEAAKLREDNALMAEELARLRAAAAASLELAAAPTHLSGVHPAGAALAAGVGGEGGRRGPAGASCSAPGGMMQVERQAAPWRTSTDSWHTDDDFDWATRPVARLADPHQQTRSPQQQTLQQHHHQQERYERRAAAAAAAAAAAELEAARETISRLTDELAEAQERLRTQHHEAQRAGSEAEAALRMQLAAAEAAAEAAAAARAEAQQTLQVLERLAAEREQLAADRDQLAAELSEAKQSAVEAADAAGTHAAAAAAATTAATSDSERLVSENDRIAGDLVSARELIASLEAKLASSAQARDTTVKELETVRLRLTRLQADMRDLRAEAQVARGEATAAWRDVKAANSEKLNAQREMEEAVERQRAVEAAREGLAVQLAAAALERRKLEARLALKEEEEEAEEPAEYAVAGRKLLAEAGAEHVAQAGPAGATSAEESTAAALVSELEAARCELAAAKDRLAEERQGSLEAQARLRGELEGLQSELAAVRTELAAVQATSREHVAALEERLARSDEDAAAVAEQQRQRLGELERCLEGAQARAGELEAQAGALNRAVATSAAQVERLEAQRAELEAVLEAARAEARGQLEAAHEDWTQAQRDMAQRHAAELELLRARLKEAAATAAAAARSLGTSASSSDAGVSAAGSPAWTQGAVGAAAAPAEAEAAGEVQQHEGVEEGEEEEGSDGVSLHARCRALRGELALTRSQLAALLQVSEAAATGRLDQAVAAAKAAVEAGQVATDQDYWAHSSEMHSLYSLVTALRATSLYNGPAGTRSTYGANRADGAGSIVGNTAGQLAALHRRGRASEVRERRGQVEELLAEAKALAQLPQYSAPWAGNGSAVAPEPLGRMGGGSSSGGGSSGAHGHPSRPSDRRSSRGGAVNVSYAAVAAAASTPPPAAAAHPGAARRAVLAADSPPGLSHGATAYMDLEAHAKYGGYGLHASDGGDGGAGAFAPRSLYGNGAEHGMGTLQPPGATSSFTSDASSSLADDDLTSLNNMYEIPPMASPPKFDFGDMDFSSIGDVN